MGWVSLLCPTHCSRVCPCSNCPLLLSSLAAAHLKFGFKAKELREQEVVLKAVCPLAALGVLLALEGLGQCKAGEELSRGLAGLGDGWETSTHST